MVEKHRRPAGEGSVYQRPDGRWEAVLSLGYGPGGKRLRRKVSAGTRAGAAEALRALCRERDQGLVVAKRLTVEKWLDEWLRDHARVTTRPNTYRTYEQIVRQHLVPAFGRYQLDRLAPSDVAAYLHEKAQKLSAKTCQHHHAVLRRALRKAEEYGYVNRNVARVVSPPTANRRTGTWLDVEQARTFLASIVDHPLESLFVVAAATGVRRGEVLGLTWDAVDLDRGTLRVQRALYRYNGAYHLDVPKSRSSYRTVTLPPPVVRLLRVRRARQAELRLRLGEAWRDRWNLVFTDDLGQPIPGETVTHAFQAALTAAGLPKFRFHDLRHSAATFLIAAGIPLKHVSELLGHSTITITADIYGHLLDESNREAGEAIGRTLFGAR